MKKQTLLTMNPDNNRAFETSKKGINKNPNALTVAGNNGKNPH